MLLLLFTVLVIFQVAHYLADFPLQNEYHLGKFNKENWIYPLAAHVHIHSLLMGISFHISGLIALTLDYNISMPLLVSLSCLIYLVNFVSHFVVDRIKASPSLGGRWKYPSKAYFNALGFDQMIHEIFNYGYVVIFFYFFIM